MLRIIDIGNDLLKNKCREKTGKGAGTFTVKRLVESVIKGRGDKFRDIEMLLKEPKKQGVLSKKIS